MSAVTMSGPDASKAAPAVPKQHTKSSSTTASKTTDPSRKQTASPVDAQNRKQPPPQPRAWQGHNPITQRPSTSAPNGTDKSASKSQPQPQAKSTTEQGGDKQANDRAVYLVACYVGHDATITTATGEQYTGVFSGASFERNKLQYHLKMTRRTALPTSQQVNGNVDLAEEYVGEGDDCLMVFDKEDTVDLFVPNVTPLTARPVQNGSASSSFRTDTEISARESGMPARRELQRWDAGADSSIDMSLGSSNETGWDQFAANERMYGVHTTYDEDIYTTQINRKDPLYRQKEAEAARLAEEIERSSSTNGRGANRRDAAEDDGMDEEDKYSSVQRDASNLPKRAAGAYVPPSQRPITNTPTVPGAPFDPAIISLEKPTTSSATASKAVEATKTPEPTTEKEAPQTEPQANSSRLSVQPSPIPSKSVTEDHARDIARNVADSFKLFANNEKLRLRQAQEVKRTTARAEKVVRINDLKKFSANFKLQSRVPDDLVPILAKDREKQLEIQQKAEEAAKLAELNKQKRKEQQDAVEPASPSVAAAPTHAAATMPAGQGLGARNQRMSGNMRAPAPSYPIQSPNRNGGLQQNRAYGRAAFPTAPQPLPADLRIPPPSSQAPVESALLSPSKGLDAGAPAFVFRPAASSFTPTTPSPHRSTGTAPKDFFTDRKALDSESEADHGQNFQPVQRLLSAEGPEDQKKINAANAGVPNAYRTPPTWTAPEDHKNASYTDSVPKAPEPAHTHSQMHTPNPSTGHMPHSHQLPPHMQGQQPGTPSGRPHFMPSPHHQHPQGYGPGMPHFGPNGSVQNSPRFPQAQMAFNGQMPMPMQQFPGGQMQGYGMSPNMQYRTMQMPPQGPMMMGGGFPQGQMPMPPQGYQRGPQGYNQGMMPGMPSQNGPPGNYMHGPMSGPPSGPPSYSPMPVHPQPHMHQQHGNPFAGSPRPAHMMQHTSSHQGFQSSPQHMGGAPGMNGPQMGGYPSGPPHMAHGPYMGQRQMSHGGAGYPQMTPRQGQAMPAANGAMQPSPGNGMGDEGK